MSKQDDGGPAMPVTFKHEHHNGEVTYREHPGMSLRDWFAGMALARVAHEYIGGQTDAKAVAEDCYFMADAMLRARAVDGGGR